MSLKYRTHSIPVIIKNFNELIKRPLKEIKNYLERLPPEEKGLIFEEFIEFLYKGHGWVTKRMGGKGDVGADILLYHPESLDYPTVIIQTKNQKTPLTFDDTKIE